MRKKVKAVSKVVGGLSVKEVADRLGVSADTVTREIKAGRLKATRRSMSPQSPWLISEAALDVYQADLMASSPPA